MSSKSCAVFAFDGAVNSKVDLAAGATIDDIIVEYPDLTKAHIMACLGYARDLAAFEAAG